jgi:4-hydroxy-tetrahydrodipicolinate reductase
MRIALLGYGRMGKVIEGIAVSRGHEIVLKIDVANQNDVHSISKSTVDAVIEFSSPEAAFENLKICMQKAVPTVSGTTGWLNKKSEIENLCLQHGGAFFYASNYSIGVNLFFRLNKILAKMMSPYSNYKASMDEIHHTMKLDAPSGTAITLAEGVVENNDQYTDWVNDKTPEEGQVNIHSIREGLVPGTHTVRFQSEIDKIEITHEAFGREGFALGAVMAAEWLVDKTGVKSMDDLLGEMIF